MPNALFDVQWDPTNTWVARARIARITAGPKAHRSMSTGASKNVAARFISQRRQPWWCASATIRDVPAC